jgi:hypothetical protein
MRALLFFVMCSAYILLASSHSQAQYKIVHGTFGSGGGMSSGSGTTLQSTFGQSFVGISQNDTQTVGSGFWYAVQSNFVTNVERIDDMIPHEFRLNQNYPNPFNPSTSINFTIPRQEHVVLVVYDLMGRVVATLVDEQLAPGEYTAVFDAGRIASGMYLYRIQAGSYVTTQRMILLK